MSDTYDSNEARYRAEAETMTRNDLELHYECCVRVVRQMIENPGKQPAELNAAGIYAPDLTVAERLVMRGPRELLEAATVAAQMAGDALLLPIVLALPLTGVRP